AATHNQQLDSTAALTGFIYIILPKLEHEASRDPNDASSRPEPLESTQRSLSNQCTMTILVGTASWTDKSLIDSGKFYPRDATSAEDRLRYYASEFPMVEVDSSYYAIPAPQTAQLWAERTPRNFTFNVKAFRALTGHQFQAKALPKDLQLAIGAGAENLYYKDLPAELQTALW